MPLDLRSDQLNQRRDGFQCTRTRAARDQAGAQKQDLGDVTIDDVPGYERGVDMGGKG